MTWSHDVAEQINFAVKLYLARSRRLARLLVFGFEQLVLSRLFERRQAPGTTIAAAVLHTKSIDDPPPELLVHRDDYTGKPWSHGFSSVYASLFLNLRTADEFSPVRHARPAPPFPGVYLWDSAYIAQIWKWWDPRVAWDVLSAVLNLRAGDRLQHFASEFSSSSLTQPPLLAWSLDQLGRIVAPALYRQWLAAAYAPLRSYHVWLFANRRLPNGLFAWAHAYESGVENAPRFSSRDERRLDDTRRLAAPDFCSYVVLHCEALARMARVLGKCDDALEYEHQAGALRVGVNAILWDEESGLYLDRDHQSGRFIRSRTIASLLPLWAGIPDRNRLARLLEQVLAPEAFNTFIPLPSVALDDPHFERDMWRGPVWINTAYSVIEGLRRYNLHDVASDLAYRLCDGVYRTFSKSGHFYEFYDPTAIGIQNLDRKRGNRWKRISLGGRPVADFVGWTGLVNTLVIETLFGLQFSDRGLAIRPRFPPAAKGHEFLLSIPFLGLKINLAVLPGCATRGTVAGPAGEHSFHVPFGGIIPCDAVLSKTKAAASA